VNVLNLIQDLKIVPEPKQLTTIKFPVYYWDENGELKDTDWVRPMPFMGQAGEASLSDLIHLQEELLKIAVFETAAIGALICNPQALQLIGKMAAMMCVVGRKERGIRVNDLLNSGDYLQVGQIFLSEGYTDDNIIPDDYKPSAIARIHRMNFSGKLVEYSRTQIAKQQEELVPTVTAPTQPVTPVTVTTPTLPAVPLKSI
jgi:hypothetical protein